MTNKEASFLLGACRPNGRDASDPEFAAALAQASRDPALEAWIEDQRRFDSAIASGLQSTPVPADLRSRILTGGRVSRPAPWFSAQRLWAIAALVMLFLGLAVWYQRPGEWEDGAIAAVSQIVSGQATFDMMSPNVSVLQQWLSANGSPSAALPAAIQRLASAGCRMVSWHGHPISIICFHGPGGEMVHLAMIDRAVVDSPPPEGQPIYETRDGWRTATWSQGNTAMLLVTRAPLSQLRALLAIVLLF
jgi:hypothetical protein